MAMVDGEVMTDDITDFIPYAVITEAKALEWTYEFGQ